MSGARQDIDAAVESGGLPALVRRFVERVLPDAPTAGLMVNVEQVGEMVLKPGARPRRFTAHEQFAVERVAFIWRARFRMVGPLSLRVTDAYDAGDGLLEVRVLGLPVQHKRGPQLAQAEAFRYLAEIPWTPHAILANPELEWRELDERTAEVATHVNGERVAVRLIFNGAGEITQTVADRPRVEAGNMVAQWVGEYRDYQSFGGTRVPTRGEVRWELPEGAFTYWRGWVRSLEQRDAPLPHPSGREG